MSIADDVVVFPMNVANVLATALSFIDPDVVIYRRPLRTTDETECISVVEVDWDPEMRSLEFGEPSEPTIQRYTIGVQSMIKDMEEARGIRRHSVLSGLVRHMLYRDHDLQIALPECRTTLGSTTETLKRHGIAGQQFMANQAPRGGFVYLSTVEFWFETQIS